MRKITVVGGGNGAFAVAADLALNGNDVTLLELPQYEQEIEEIRVAGGIQLESLASSGRGNGFARLSNVTVNAEEALAIADAIFVVVPAFAQRTMAEFCAPYLKREQTICLMPGNLYGSIEFLRALRSCGNREVEAIAEAECLIYTATRSKGNVKIRGFKRGLGVGVFPSRCTETVAAVVRQIYPEMTVRENVMATGLSNPNVLLHVPLVLLNFANVERGLDMLSYHAAFTRGTALLVEALDAERMAFREKGLADIVSIGDMVYSWYAAQGASGVDLYTIMNTNPLYANSRLPVTKNHRYFTEDVSYGICPICELLGIHGMPNSLFAAVAKLVSAAWGTDFFAEARTLRSLGVHFNAKELSLYLKEGE